MNWLLNWFRPRRLEAARTDEAQTMFDDLFIRQLEAKMCELTGITKVALPMSTLEIYSEMDTL